MENKNRILKNTLLFIVIVIVDFLVIMGMRMVTPMIIPLRLSIIFVVFTVSIFVYYSIIKPANILKAGLILSIVAFAVALIESYVMHVYILKTGYRWMYLLPSAFALVLPFLIALLYKGMRKKA